MSTRPRAPRDLKLPNLPPRNPPPSQQFNVGLPLPDPSGATGTSYGKDDTEVRSLEELDRGVVVGVGSSGRVYRARHRETHKQYALKVIQEVQNDPLVKQQIMRELEILRRSRCRHLVQCYGIFENPDGGVAIVLEYMDVGSLAKVIEVCGRVEEKYIAEITRQVLSGLIYLHKEQHVIHRDIKPSNLLINTKAEVKIADFGVSTMLANSLAQANSVVGTWAYMSPERFNPDGYDGVKYAFSSDIWSLGLTLLEMAAGRLPFGPPPAGRSDRQPTPHMDIPTLMAAISFGEPPRAPADSSKEFQALMTVCLQKDPKHRPSARDLLEHPFLKKHPSNPQLLHNLVEILI
eukprot:TRINITY_DN489_c0_g2_i2.p1 TRINITY_DN489_c0_g2~~TRINITY_DN489_c0_g2_i2.p1  ORF type:complete len:348 (+),score=61.86 TRINITY_DN489_c0_g2_i2:219-1262(+)